MPPRKKSKTKDSQGGGTQRKTWDAAEYEAKLNKEMGGDDFDLLPSRPPPKQVPRGIVREAVTARDQSIQLDAVVGQQKTYTDASALSERGGFYCAACEVLLADSRTYLEHLNSVKHLGMIGKTARAKKATLSDVQSRLLEYANSRCKISSKRPVETASEIEARLKKQEADEAEKKRLKRERRKAKRQHDNPMIRSHETTGGPDSEEAIADAVDPEQAEMEAMGFATSFGSTSKKH